MDEIAADTDCKYHFVEPVWDIRDSQVLVSTKDRWLASCFVEAGPDLVEDIGCSHSVAQGRDSLDLQ